MFDGMLPNKPIYFSSIADNNIIKTNAVNIVVDVDNKIIDHRKNDLRYIDFMEFSFNII
jgi:hypothetical protein